MEEWRESAGTLAPTRRGRRGGWDNMEQRRAACTRRSSGDLAPQAHMGLLLGASDQDTGH